MLEASGLEARDCEGFSHSHMQISKRIWECQKVAMRSIIGTLRVRTHKTTAAYIKFTTKNFVINCAMSLVTFCISVWSQVVDQRKGDLLAKKDCAARYSTSIYSAPRSAAVRKAASLGALGPVY